ncbi:MAG: hypothetical protein COB02_04800 [Candidatus Cloacimonadota bacterium]|nr:MAG: hypothetical protein COB02_04800 [Candidatus Cloacimonadota bacterium]
MKNKKAFTLLEILMTITMATVMIVPVFNMLNLGTKGIYKSSDKTYAILIASEVIEIVKFTGFDVLPPKEEVYQLNDIIQRNNQPEYLKRNLYYSNREYEKGYGVGVLITKVEGQYDSKRIGGKVSGLRRVDVYIQWESVLTKESTTLKLSTFYKDR